MATSETTATTVPMTAHSMHSRFHATGFADFLGRLERARRGQWGYAQWSKVRGLARKEGRLNNYKL